LDKSSDFDQEWADFPFRGLGAALAEFINFTESRLAALLVYQITKFLSKKSYAKKVSP